MMLYDNLIILIFYSVYHDYHSVLHVGSVASHQQDNQHAHYELQWDAHNLDHGNAI